LLVSAWPRLACWRRARALAAPWARWSSRGCARRRRPLRRLAWLERRCCGRGLARRAATRAERRAHAAAGDLPDDPRLGRLPDRAQFVDTARSRSASRLRRPAARDRADRRREDAGEATSYLLIPVARSPRCSRCAHAQRAARGLGRVVFASACSASPSILLVDLPPARTSAPGRRFAGAQAVLYDGFYAQIAAAAG
jgi:hypothetical protein